MKYETFEDYLQGIFFREEPQTLDDQFPDAFNDWLEGQDINDIIAHEELWGKKLIKNICKQATQRQAEYLAQIISKQSNDHAMFKEIMDKTPKNNEKYPNVKADYRQLILADKLSILSSKQADYCIKAYLGERGYHVMTARSILTNLFQ